MPIPVLDPVGDGLHLTMPDDRPAGDGVWTATGHERPVFLDEHGRRRRWVLLGGAIGGGASALWLAALVAGAIGFSSLPAIGSAPHLIAARAAANRAAVVARHHRAKVPRRPPSGLGRAAELAVSRGLFPEH